MRTYHPLSWSKQARIMADKLFETYTAAKECTDENSWLLEPEGRLWDSEEYAHIISDSYRASIIKNRAAKRFGRLVRKYKV